MKISSSLLKSSCARKLWLTQKGYKLHGEQEISLVFGKAFHKYRESLAKIQTTGYMKHSMALIEAYKLFEDTPKYTPDKKAWMNLAKLEAVCSSWFTLKDYPPFELLLHTDGTPCVEQQFAVPFMDSSGNATDNPECSVYLCGTIDMKGFVNQAFCIGDIKTTTSWNSTEFLESFELSGQLRLYAWVVYKMKERFPSSRVSMMIPDAPIGTFIDGVFLKAKEHEFRRSSIYYITREQAEEAAEMARHRARIILGEMPAPEGMLTGSCETFGIKCPFQIVCKSKGHRDLILDSMFINRPYDPLNYD